MTKRFDGEQANPQTLRYHQLNGDESPLTTSNVQGLTLYVFDVDDGSETTPDGGEDLEVTSCVFDSLQPWGSDNEGYNLKVKVKGEYFPNGNRTYRVEVKVTPTLGEPFYVDHVEIRTTPTLSA